MCWRCRVIVPDWIISNCSIRAEKDGDMIQAEGLVRLCEDLGVDPSDIAMVRRTRERERGIVPRASRPASIPDPQLVISFHMNAASMGEYSKEEFTSGMVKMACDSVEKLKAKIPELRKEMQNDEKFKDIYNYAYMFSREVSDER